MGKMAKRQRKKKKAKKKLAKFMESLSFIKPRAPVPPPGFSFKSKKDYDRRDNKKAVDKAMNEDD